MTRRLLPLLILSALALPGCGIFGISDVITGAQAGVAFVKQGKFHSFDEVSFEDALAATHRAGDSLSLKLLSEKIKDTEATLVYQDEHGQKIDITLQRRTKTITATYIDVGIFGTVGMARITLAEIINQLLSAKAYKENWEHLQPPPSTGTRPVSSVYTPEDSHRPLGGNSGLIIPGQSGRPVITAPTDDVDIFAPD